MVNALFVIVNPTQQYWSDLKIHCPIDNSLKKVSLVLVHQVNKCMCYKDCLADEQSLPLLTGFVSDLSDFLPTQLRLVYLLSPFSN